MEIRNWNGKKVEWRERMSKVGWLTRFVAFAAILFVVFIKTEIQMDTFCWNHRTFTSSIIAAYAVLTAFFIAWFYFHYERYALCRQDFHDVRPKRYPISKL